MIVYGDHGYKLLLRVHGSAAYKSAPLACISSFIFIGYTYLDLEDNNKQAVRDPYAIGAFVVFYSFLITFRLNFAYGRYWEGATALYRMMSRWSDCAMCMSAFHYQSAQYDDIKPPTYISLSLGVTREKIKGRDRNYAGTTFEKTVRHIRASSLNGGSLRWRKNSISEIDVEPKSINIKNTEDLQTAIPIPTRFQNQTLGLGHDYSCKVEDLRQELATRKQHRGSHHLNRERRAKLPSPSLYLQETAHLISLLNAVAMSTLRDDLEHTALPLKPYIPGMEWPSVDPDTLSHDIMRQYGEAHPLWRWFYFCFGKSRSKRRRTMYNAARPFAVLGGVSDVECELLQNARGPYAKVALCTMWLQEFLSREYLNGSQGAMAPPIVSVLYSFISDGMSGYNEARKVAYIPFPFPNGQITAFFSLAIMFVFPLLFTSFVTKLWFGCLLNFLTVLCFLGLYEVARELETPFQNVPNDLPLNYFQAQFNESLITMYAGYAPDSWWEVPDAESSDLEDDEEHTWKEAFSLDKDPSS